MLRLAALIVGSRQEAEDVVQDAFLALSLRWDVIDNPGAYLRTSVINGANTVLRRRRTSNDRPIPLLPPSTTQGVGAIELADALAALAPNTLDIATDPASIFDDTARRLTPTNMDSGAWCMRHYVRLGIQQKSG